MINLISLNCLITTLRSKNIIEKKVALSILKLTNKQSVDLNLISKNTKLDKRNVKTILKKFNLEGLISLSENSLEINNYSRIILSIKAIELGADIEYATSLLCWQEFEGIAAIALERNNFSVKKNVRFTYAKKRNEIDLVGLKKPIVLSIDCKHWHREIKPSSLKNIVTNQINRTKSLMDSLPNITTKIECTTWENVTFVPAILSLMPIRNKFYNLVPIISILQFQDFLNQFQGYINRIKYFKKTFYHLP